MKSKNFLEGKFLLPIEGSSLNCKIRRWRPLFRNQMAAVLLERSWNKIVSLDKNKSDSNGLIKTSPTQGNKGEETEISPKTNLCESYLCFYLSKRLSKMKSKILQSGPRSKLTDVPVSSPAKTCAFICMEMKTALSEIEGEQIPVILSGDPMWHRGLNPGLYRQRQTTGRLINFELISTFPLMLWTLV